MQESSFRCFSRKTWFRIQSWSFKERKLGQNHRKCNLNQLYYSKWSILSIPWNRTERESNRMRSASKSVRKIIKREWRKTKILRIRKWNYRKRIRIRNQRYLKCDFVWRAKEHRKEKEKRSWLFKQARSSIWCYCISWECKAKKWVNQILNWYMQQFSLLKRVVGIWKCCKNNIGKFSIASLGASI